ncbi:MAG: outer membrane beta-barrel protein [Bacteroidota bacterium]
MDFLKWYKNKVESGEEEPPPELWDEIQNDLDIDLVYKRLEKSLARDKREVWLWRATAAAGILLLLATGALLLFSPEQQTQFARDEEPQSQQKDTMRIVEPHQSPEEEVRMASLVSQPARTKPLQEEHDAISTVLIVPESKGEEFSRPQEQGDEALTGFDHEFEHEFKNIPQPSYHLPETEYTPVTPELSLRERPSLPEKNFQPEEKSGPFSTFTVSVNGEIANTWVVNNKTIEGMNPDELTATQATFNGNYGIGLETNLSPRWDLIGQLSLTRQQGQNYQEYIQGQYVSNNINLEYFDVALRARYYPLRDNMHHSFSAGLYNGFLKSASRKTGRRSQNITSEYTDTDFGVVAGYEYRASLSDHITLGTGIFLRSGLKNVFSGNQMISSNLNQSYNTSVNFSLSVGYTFSL